MKRNISNYLVVIPAAAMLITTSLPAHAIKLVSGGVGESGEEMIQRVENRYNLKMIFTGNRGMYLSDVAVSLKDANNKELATGTTSGPILLGELAPGTYSVTASKGGVEKKRTLKLDSDLRTYHVTFPVKDEPVGETMAVAPLKNPALVSNDQATHKKSTY